MSARVALLRGANVGKAKRVPMAELRALAGSLGFADARTHLQSGNLVYTSGATAGEDRDRFATALEERFGFAIDVVIVDGARLAEVLAVHPFADGDPKRVHVGYGSGPLPESLVNDLRALAREGERFAVDGDGDVLFADFTQGVHDSRAATALPRLVRPGFITLRNLATVRAVADMVG